MSNATCIGRVGGMAAALGVGLAVATTSVVASAEPANASPSSSNSATSGSSTSETGSSESDSASGVSSESSVSQDGSATADSSGSAADVSSTTAASGEDAEMSAGADTGSASPSDDRNAAESVTGTASSSEDGPNDSAAVADAAPSDAPVDGTVAAPVEHSAVAVDTEHLTAQSWTVSPVAEPAGVVQDPFGAGWPFAPDDRHQGSGAAAENPVTDAVRAALPPELATVQTPIAAPPPAPIADRLSQTTAAVQTATTPVATMPITSLPTPVVPTLSSDPPTSPSVVSRMLSSVLAAAGLSPTILGRPFTPVESPAHWAVLAAWLRRQDEESLAEATPSASSSATPTSRTGDTVATTAMMAPASAATTSLTGGAVDHVTGTVTGTVSATGNQSTYAVTGQPATGTASVDNTGRYTYTPTQAARLAAGQTAGADTDTDSFTVTVTDGQTSTPVTVTVPVSSTQLRVDQSITVGSSPSGMVVSGNYAYVANQGSNTVSVINTTTGALVDTKPSTPSVDPITVGSAPTAVVASPDGSKVYVANSGSATVSVIDTATNKVTNTITVGVSPQGLALGGNRLYVANTGSGTVSVINTDTNQRIDANPSIFSMDIAVGSSPQGLALGGNRLYVANTGSATVSVINTATYQLVDTNPSTSTIDSIKVGSSPTGLAASPDGGRVYVTNRTSGTVSVIDTKTNTVANTITVANQPSSVKISPDGSLAYVANGNDTVSVIDTKNNSVISTVAIDPNAETGGHAIALSPDGTHLYVTDAVDRTVRVVSLVHVNTAPQAAAAPTVGTPDAGTGVVSGSLKMTDIDGDKLNYTTTSAPSNGAVSVDANGTYTYTPTAAARQHAAQTPGDDYDQFIVAVSDGQATTNVTVTVPVSAKAAPQPPTVSITPITVGADPTAVVISGNRAYVANRGDNTVSVIDTATKHVVATVPVGSGPNSVVATGDGTRVYVANSAYTGDNTVSVIDTATNTVIATIPIPNQNQATYGYDLAVSPDGARVYVAYQYDSRISVIDTDPTSPTYNTVISTTNVGYYGAGSIKVTPDGTRIYRASDSYGDVVVIDTATMTPVGTVDIFSGQPWFYAQALAISADGTRAYAPAGYVTEGGLVYSAVSVIDTDPTSATYNTEIATIYLPGGDGFYYSDYGGVFDVAFSPDGNRAYITSFDGKTTTVIDTVSNTVVGSFTIDEGSADSNLHRSLAVGTDGTLYIVDADGAVYAVTVGDSSTAQQM